MTSTSFDSVVPSTVRLDAAITGAFGVLIGVASPLLDGRLGIDAALLLALGVVLVGYALVLEFVVARRPTRPLVWEVIAINLVWVVSSVVAVVTDVLTPTTLGTVFVLLQAAAVALIAGLQLLALRRGT